MKKTPIYVLVLLFFAACSPKDKTVYDITAYGAKGDSATVCTQFIQKAIDEAHAAGGGKVLVPPGIYVTGTLVLKDNVSLCVAQGAKLAGSPRHEDYITVEKAAAKMRSNRQSEHLIYAHGAKNITICGNGTIDGNGAAFWKPFSPDTLPRWIHAKPDRVSNMVELVNCQNVKIRDVLLTHSPSWTLHLFDCDQVFVHNIRLVNNLYGPNNDGIDISGCRNVTISDSYIKTCDDAVCVKTFPASRTSYNITVTNCVMQTTCVALKMGETYKNIRDITFSNCVITRSSRAFGIYAKHGGTIENVLLDNIVCNTNAPLVLNRPIQIGIWPDSKRNLPAGEVRNITISNFTATTQGRILLTAVEGTQIENLTLKNIKLIYPYIEDPTDLAAGTTSNQFAAIELEAKKAKAAIVAQNVKNLIVDNLDVTWPTDTFEAAWKHAERIENGSLRVHTPAYASPRETEFSLLWGKNIENGYVFAPWAKASSAETQDYVLENSEVKITHQ